MSLITLVLCHDLRITEDMWLYYVKAGIES